MSDWNTNIIEEFRANDGNVGGIFEGAALLILGTTGAKSGQARLSPLMFKDEDDRRFIFASKAGAHTHPDWFHNLVANDVVTVEAPGETYQAVATVLDEPERSEVYLRQGEAMPQFAAYQAGTDRAIPVVELSRV